MIVRLILAVAFLIFATLMLAAPPSVPPQTNFFRKGGAFRIGDLTVKIPPSQPVFSVNDRNDRIVSARDPIDGAAPADARSFSLTYRHAGAPESGISLAFMAIDDAFGHDSWCARGSDGGAGGASLKPASARGQEGGFYLHDNTSKRGTILVTTGSQTFFGAPLTLSRGVNGDRSATNDFSFSYLTGAGLSPNVMLMVSFSDVATKSIPIPELLKAIEKDVRDWTSPASGSLGRTNLDCE